MKFFKSAFFSAASRLNIEWLKKNAPVDVLIPYHHLVSDEPVPHIQSLYQFKTTRQFEEDIDFLLKHFQPVSLTDIIEHIRCRKRFSKKSFLLTFDDGLRQVYETAAPVLLRKGVPAALFINPAFVDNKELFYDIKKGLILHQLKHIPVAKPVLKNAEKIFGQKLNSAAQLRHAVQSINYLNKNLADDIGRLLAIDFEMFRQTQKPFMSTEQIQSLIRQGFGVGAHSINHPLYQLIPLQEQIRQTAESVNWVCSTFHLPYKAFAFPHVDTGVSDEFFHHFSQPTNALDLILGNSTAMLEQHPLVRHRYIGEAPSVSAGAMAKSVLAYSIMRKMLHRSFMKRNKNDGQV